MLKYIRMFLKNVKMMSCQERNIGDKKNSGEKMVYYKV